MMPSLTSDIDELEQKILRLEHKLLVQSRVMNESGMLVPNDVRATQERLDEAKLERAFVMQSRHHIDTYRPAW